MANNDTVREDQKHRAMAALERRFAAEKAGLELHHQTINVTSNFKLQKHSSNSAKSSSVRKGNFTFVGHVTSDDFDKNGQTYLKLSESVHEKLLTPNSSDSKESKVDTVLHGIFQNGDGSQKYLRGSKSIRIDNWLLLDNCVQGRSITANSRLRALQIHSKRSKKHMSLRQLKKKGVLDLPKEFHKYEIYRPVHENWQKVMTQLVKKNGTNQLGQLFLEADLHGALVLVVDCKITSFNGVNGVVIRETAETFGIITLDDKFRVVPKKFSVFVFQIDMLKIKMLGDKLTSRNVTLNSGL